MKPKSKILNFFLNLDLVIAGIALIALITVTFTGVFMRYAFNAPILWQEEVQLWCFVWVVFFGASAAFRNNGHVVIDILVDRLPLKVQKYIEIANYFIVMAVLFYLMLHGSNLVTQMLNTGRNSNILRVPYSLIYSVFPIGCILMMISYTLSTGISVLFNKDIGGGE